MTAIRTIVILLALASGLLPASANAAAIPIPAKSEGSRTSGLSAVNRANRSALREPKESGYARGVHLYAWTEGALYRLYTAPEQVSDIALQPGEALTSVAAGDTVRWIIGDTTSGMGPTQRTHILVKPSAAGLKTNLVITTDRRVYHVQLISTAATAMASIGWTYAEDALLALRRPQAAPPGQPIPALELLNFHYRISGDRPAWRPLRAFDDGRQVFIEFPPVLAVTEAPPLFVTGAKGALELVNYRIRGRFYVVDRLFDRAELRLGGRPQQIVRIARTARPERRR